MEQVRDQQQPSGRLERAIMLGGHCCELEDRVDRQQLDAGALIELARGNPVEQQCRGCSPPGVPVVGRRLDQFVAVVEQAEVDGPRVDGE